MFAWNAWRRFNLGWPLELSTSMPHVAVACGVASQVKMISSGKRHLDRSWQSLVWLSICKVSGKVPGSVNELHDRVNPRGRFTSSLAGPRQASRHAWAGAVKAVHQVVCQRRQTIFTKVGKLEAATGSRLEAPELPNHRKHQSQEFWNNISLE